MATSRTTETKEAATKEAVHTTEGASETEETAKATEVSKITDAKTTAVKATEPTKITAGGIAAATKFIDHERGLLGISESVHAGLVPSPFAKRLPSGYGGVELSESQRAEIYRIQEEYHLHLQLLDRRGERLKAERDGRIAAVLTVPQKQTLENRKSPAKKD